MSTQRGAFIGSFLVSPNNCHFQASGSNKSLSVGTFYYDINTLLDDIEVQLQTVYPTADCYIHTNCKVNINNAPNLIWQDIDLRDFLGFTANISSSACQATNPVLFSFPMTKPIKYDSDIIEEINIEEGIADSGRRVRKNVANTSFREIEISYKYTERTQFNNFMRFASRGLPFSYYPDMEDMSEYYRLILDYNDSSFDEEPETEQLKFLYTKQLKLLTHEGTFTTTTPTDFWDLLTQPIYNAGIYCRISGVPYIFTQQNPITGSANWSTPSGYTVLESLALNENKLNPISQKLDFEKGVVQLGSFNISLCDDTSNTLANLFARFKTGGKTLQLSKSLNYEETNYLTTRTDNSSWGSSGDLYLGYETIGYDIKSGSTTFDVLTRAKYGSTKTKYDYDDTGIISFGEISDWPRVWKGRILETWVYARDFNNRAFDTGYFSASNYQICFKSIIYSEPFTADGCYYQLHCNSINEILNGIIAKEQPTGKLLMEADIFNAYKVSTNTEWENAIDAISNIFTNQQHAVQSHEKDINNLFIIDDSNNLMSFQVTSASLTETYKNCPLKDSSKPDCYAKGVYRWDCDTANENGLKQVLMDTVIKNVDTGSGHFESIAARGYLPIFSIENNKIKCGIIENYYTFKLLFSDNYNSIAPTIGFNSEDKSATYDDTKADPFVWIWGDYELPDYSISSDSRYIYFMPDKNSPTWKLQNTYDGYGYALIEGKEVVKFVALNSSSLDLPGGTNANIIRLDCLNGRGRFGTGKNYISVDSENPITIKQCLGWEGKSYAQIHLELLCSRKGDKSNYYSPMESNNYDVLTWGGLGCDTRLINTGSFVQKINSHIISDTRDLLISKPTEYLDLLKQDCLLDCSYLSAKWIVNQLQLSLDYFKDYVPSLYSMPIGVNNYTFNQKPCFTGDNTTVYNHITINAKYNPLKEDFEKLDNEYIFDASVSEYGLSKTLDIKNQGIILDNTTANQLFQFSIERYFSKFSYPRKKISFAMLPSGLKLNAGDIVLLTVPWLRGNQGSALSSSPFIIEEIKHIFYSKGNNNYFIGIIASELDPTSTFRAYNPSAKVSNVGDNGDGTGTITLTANHYTMPNQMDLLNGENRTMQDIDFFDHSLIGADFSIELYDRGTENVIETVNIITTDRTNNILNYTGVTTIVASANTRIRHCQYGSATTWAKKWAYVFAKGTTNAHVWSD